jgi:hypothetical protein
MKNLEVAEGDLARWLDLLAKLKKVAEAIDDLRGIEHPTASVAASKGVDAMLTMFRQIDSAALDRACETSTRMVSSVEPPADVVHRLGPRNGSRRGHKSTLSESQRRRVVERARTENNAALALEIGISERTLAKWKKRYLLR